MPSGDGEIGRALGSGEGLGVGAASVTAGVGGRVVDGGGLGVGVGLGVTDGLGDDAARDGVAGAVAAGVGGGVAAPAVSGAHAGRLTPGGAPHTEPIGDIHTDPSAAVRDSEMSAKGWRAESGAPQGALSQSRSSVAVPPSTVAVLPVRRHRPTLSAPRAYRARMSRLKLMNSELAGGKTFASPRLDRKLSYAA